MFWSKVRVKVVGGIRCSRALHSPSLKIVKVVPMGRGNTCTCSYCDVVGCYVNTTGSLTPAYGPAGSLTTETGTYNLFTTVNIFWGG